MSKSDDVVLKAANKSFAYRNIQKDFTIIPDTEQITKNFHLEQGAKNECSIVEDRNDDWFKFQQQNLDQVGLANIIALAQRRGEDPYDGRYAFNDEEALDLGDLDPKDPEGIKSAVSSIATTSQKLEALANQLGISQDKLIESVLNGTIKEVIAQSIKSESKEEGGKE